MRRPVTARLLLLAPLVAAAVGCGPAGGEGTGQQGWDQLTFTNDKAAYDYFRAKGLTNFQAAGIVGNLDQESGVDPAAVQQGGPGRGIAQWSVGGRWDTDANDNATWYATKQGQSVSSLQLQLDFIWYELTTFSSYGLAALEASTDVTSATIAFQNDFEGCGTCDQSTRISYAQNVLNLYGNDPVIDGGTLPEASVTTCTVPNLGMGECISTTQCASMAGFTATPGYCPGPTNIQCCTGPWGSSSSSSSSGGSGSSSGTGSSSGGSSGGSSGSSGGGSSSSSGGGASGSSSGVGTGGSSGGGSNGGGSSGGGGSGADGGGLGGNGASPAQYGSNGCSTSGGRAEGGLAGWALASLGLALGVKRRRSRRGPVDRI